MRKRVLAAVAVLVILAGAYWLSKRESGRRFAVSALLASVQKLNQLATVKYTMQQVVGIREQKQPVGEESILLILRASVEGGVDLAGLTAEGISIRPDGTVVVKLPPAQILHVVIDEKETKVWDRSKTWWTPWVPFSPELEQKARMQGVEALRKAALEMGILSQAEGNAETAVRELLTAAGVKSVLVIRAGRS